MPLNIEADSIADSHRDSIQSVADASDDPPKIVSISDIHGYLDETRDALLTLRDHPEYDPIATEDEDGTLHWADENYVLIFNGDLVDRGPNPEAVLDLVARLYKEAPAGHVRVTLGNHEWMILMPKQFEYPDWFSLECSDPQREEYIQRILDGHVVTAYDGYNYQYVHAGGTSDYDTESVNNRLIEAAEELQSAIGTLEDRQLQSELPKRYSTILGTGDRRIKAPPAGLVWLGFDYHSESSPPQIVGHTRQTKPAQIGDVYGQDLLQDNLSRPGGHGVFVETPDSLSALIRRDDGNVDEVSLA